MRRLREEVHHRLLGNGWVPAALDCHFESICETCTHFATDATDATFQPSCSANENHAASNRQDARAALSGGCSEHCRRTKPAPLDGDHLLSPRLRAVTKTAHGSG